jgi:hypothetical protein
MIYTGDAPKSLLSANKKFSKNQKEAKEVFEYYAANKRSIFDIERIRENQDLHRGSWKKMEREANNGRMTQIEDELVEIGKVEILHYPIISKVTKDMESTLIRMPLSFTIKDNSAKSNNVRKEQRIAIIQQKLSEKYVKPLQESITQQVLLENQIDPTQPMDNQILQQMQEMINKRMQEQTPESITEALKSVRTPDEVLSSKLLSTAILEHKVKQQTVNGGVGAILSGEEYYRISIIDNRLHFENLKTENLVWGGSDNVENSEDGLFAVYRQGLTPEDVIGRYGTLLSTKKVEKLYSLFSPLQGDSYLYDEQKKTMLEFNASDLLPIYQSNPQLGNIDHNTREGQSQMWNLRNAVYGGYKRGGQIVETYVTWRWTRKMKMVERMETEGKEIYYFDEHYEEQPNDIKVTEFYAEEVWEGAALGEGEDREYVYLRPVPYQYPDLKNPRSPKLTIWGGRYNTLNNAVRVTTPVDLAKPFQADYNYLRAKMKQEEGTEIGRVFTMISKAKPRDWSWQQWMDALRNDKMLMLDTSYDGYNPNDTMAFRGLDLGMQDRIMSYMARLQDAENKIYSVMNKNPAAMGNIGQYATDSNIQATMEGSENQTLSFFDRHRQIVENVLNGLLNAAMIAYKYHGYQKDIILDEFSKTYFETQEPFQACAFQLFVVNSNEEKTKLERMRAQALSLIQNGSNPVDIARIEQATTIDEIVEILEISKRKAEEAKQKDQEFQMQMQDKQLQAQQAAQKEKMDLERYRIDTESKTKIETSRIMAQQMAMSQDIDQDGTNDANQRQLIELEAKMELEYEKLDLEREKLAKGIKIR